MRPSQTLTASTQRRGGGATLHLQARLPLKLRLSGRCKHRPNSQGVCLCTSTGVCESVLVLILKGRLPKCSERMGGICHAMSSLVKSSERVCACVRVCVCVPARVCALVRREAHDMYVCVCVLQCQNVCS